MASEGDQPHLRARRHHATRPHELVYYFVQRRPGNIADAPQHRVQDPGISERGIEARLTPLDLADHHIAAVEGRPQSRIHLTGQQALRRPASMPIVRGPGR